jgi:two-component system response regulator LytT
MKVLIIEDELNAARQLRELIIACRPLASFEPDIDNVEDAVSYFKLIDSVDLVFLDINLSEGLAFQIFESSEIFVPVIFTTAYDQYAIKAFEVNSIDYLLKPVSKSALEKALAKFDKNLQFQKLNSNAVYLEQLRKLFSATKIYKENFLVPFKDKLVPVPAKDFAWFELKNSVVLGTRFDKTSLVMEERSLDELSQLLSPEFFYRANRQYLINKVAVKEIAQYFNGKLVATLIPAPAAPVVISREKAYQFKEWMGS